MTKRFPWVSLGLSLTLAGCSTPGGWKGAVAENAYDKELDAQRLVAIINNDDYYEYHQDGRIYVLADAKDVKSFLGSGEIPLRLTRIGGGPKGETLVFAIAQPEKNKKDGFGSVEIFDGRRKGYDKSFYAEVKKDNRYIVFGDWNSFDAYRRSGQMPQSSTGTAPDGTPVFFAQADAALAARFQSLHAAN